MEMKPNLKTIKKYIDKGMDEIEKDSTLFDLEEWAEEQETGPVKRRKRTRAIPSRKRK